MIFTDHTAEYYATFNAAAESLDEIRQFVQSALLTTGLNKKAIAGLLLAVEEAVSNIIRHGYLYGPGRFRLRIRATRRLVTLTLHDNGRAYEVNWDDKPDAHKLAETGRRGGLGLLLIRKVTDAVDYKRIGDENILTMTKYLGPVENTGGHRAFSRKVAAIGLMALVAVTVFGATLLFLHNRSTLQSEFVARWQEFARAAAASATQHMLNDRSDAEFDQLVVGLKQAQPDVSYLIIADEEGRVRAHSETPEAVHSPYMPPHGAALGQRGFWSVIAGGHSLFHFSEPLTIDRRNVGTIALAVDEEVLGRQVSAEFWRVVIGALSVIAIGGVLVGLVAFFMGRPLRRLGDVLRQAKSQGAVANITPGSAPDEIAEVVTAINDVTEAVARSERQIARRDQARREMEQAEQLQRALLPLQLPAIDGYEAQAAYRMAQHVGGDYYDVIPIDNADGLWAIIVADVAGKGFPAALVMTAVRTAMRILVPARRSPATILQDLDAYLAQHHPNGPFVTVVCGVLDTRRHRLTLASAGHTPALHYLNSTGTILRVNPKGRPIGVRIGDGAQSLSLAEQEITLADGDAIVLYTDGLIEARNRAGESYGMERVEDCLKVNKADARTALDAIISALNEFSEGGGSEDDVTILVLRRGRPAESAQRRKPESISILPQNIAATF
jgi:serine phosphatase RsbU (regulator of sigma subunit)/anti-sigma regulatory factor (Ser/Thr protein kinase)